MLEFGREGRERARGAVEAAGPSLNMPPEARAVGPEGVHQLVDRRTHPPRTGRQRVDGDLIVIRDGHRDSRTSRGNQNRAAMGEGVGGDRSRAVNSLCESTVRPASSLAERGTASNI